MPTPDIGSLRAFVNTALLNRGDALWFPGLAEALAQVAWDELENSIGLTRDCYGTARLFLRNPLGPRSFVARCSAGSIRRSGVVSEDIPVEVLPSGLAQQIAGYDVRFVDAQTVAGTVAGQLEEALSFLYPAPTLWRAVCTLVRALHIIEASDDEVDVSFSDPSMPFSVFVSVPRVWSEVAPVRVAESILHEAMHLQLTLVERVVPLVLPQQSWHFSPWRDEPRSSEGVLQALYVFGVIRSFLRAIPRRGPSLADDHVTNRIAEITRQIEQAQEFQQCNELTTEGAKLVERLLDTAD